MPTMLPSVPKTFGRLSDVLSSASLSLAGQSNSLQLRAAKSAIVILVDGLGYQNLRDAAGHARFLNSALQGSKPINTVLPSTTAAALTTLATGAQPHEHGIVGYRVFDRSTGRDQNLLSGWQDFDESKGWRQISTVSERALETGQQVVFVGPEAYERSGFTNIIMPAAKYLPANRMGERFELALKASADACNLTYLYIPELDQAAHAHGVGSVRWTNLLEELDSLVRDLAERAPRSVGILLSADHGIVDVPANQHIHLDRLDLPKLAFYGGDTRCGFLYLANPQDALAAKQTINDALAPDATAITPAEAISAGWLGAPGLAAERLLPDLLILANRNVAIYHSDFSSKKSYEMVGHHGSWSAAELQIPLIRMGAWSLG